MRYILLLALYVGITVYCLADIQQRPERSPYGLRKFVWVLLVILVPYVGGLAWIVIKFIRPGGLRGGAQRGPSAPDDDLEYLDWLERQERRRKRDGKDEVA